MKNRIISLILAIVLLVPMLVVVASAADTTTTTLTASNYVTDDCQSEAEKLAQMDKYAENDGMALYVHPISGELGIKNKVTGEIILSNPYNVTKAGNNDAAKQQYVSTLLLTFKTISDGGEKTYYSFKDSAIYDNQMHIDPYLDENGNQIGAIVTYEFGKKEMVFPLAIHNDDLERIFDDMRAKDEAIAESHIKNIKGKYELSEENNVWILRGNTSVYNRNKLATQFEWAGYTIEKMHEDYAKINFDFTTGILNYGTYKDAKIGNPAEPYFKTALIYELTNDGFNVKLDASKVEYDTKSYSLSSVGIFPFFNAANHATDSGYTFLPDGSGTLVRYEDLRAAGITDNILIALYGPDYAYYKIEIKNQEQAAFPVFGSVITTSGVNSGYFAIIEECDTLASIMSHNDAYFNSAYATFQLSSSDKYDLADSFSSGNTSSNVITINGTTRYNGMVNVKYVVLTPSSLNATNSPSAKYDTSYIGMANYYRDYLQANGTLSKIKAEDLDEYTRIFLEVFGSLQVEEKIATFPVTVSKELTTFADIMKIHKELSNIGVDNMSFILTGFANGGLEEKYPTYLKWQKVLGGAKGFEALMEYAIQNGVEIAPSVNFSYAQQLKNFSGFKYKKTAARALDGRYTSRREYDASVQMFQRKGGVVISTDSYELAYTKFIKSASEYNITSLATRKLGSDLSSDFDSETGYILREDSKKNTQKFLNLLSGKTPIEGATQSNYKLILGVGNVYSLPYASGLTNVSLDSSRFLSTSEAVPFTGIVLHGSIEFAGDPINMEGDDKYMFLKALENGAGLYFTIAMQNTELLKGTNDYNQYYSVQFSIWRDEIARMYQRYNELMASKQSSYITEHEFLNADEGYVVIREMDIIENPNIEPEHLNNSRVVRVEYSNGEGFLLNYNSYDVIVEYEGESVKISALGYVPYGMEG